MKRVLLFIMSLLASVSLAGCGTNGQEGFTNGNDDITASPNEQIASEIGSNVAANEAILLIASEKTLPSDFDEIANERERAPYYQYLIKKSHHQSEFADAWDLYNFDSRQPSIDWDEKDVMFIGLQESGEGAGNCPTMIENIELHPEEEAVEVFLKDVGTHCEEMATPRIAT